jgi:hypothetical protein
METKTNYFNELFEIDISKYIKQKGKLDYLSWAWAVKKLREKQPTARWDIKRFGEEQLPYLKTELGYFVEVAVTVNEITLSQIHPVLDSYNHAVIKPNAFQINTSIQRCLAKAIALHGLGLSLYAGEDLPNGDSHPAESENPTESTQVASTPLKTNSTTTDIICEECGKEMRLSKFLDKNDNEYYYCPDKECGHKHWPVKVIYQDLEEY